MFKTFFKQIFKNKMEYFARLVLQQFHKSLIIAKYHVASWSFVTVELTNVTSQDYVININSDVCGNTSVFIDHPLHKHFVSAHWASRHAWTPDPPRSKSGAGPTDCTTSPMRQLSPMYKTEINNKKHFITQRALQ